MTNTQLYLPMALPQWGIFAGIVLLTVGYVDKRKLWTLSGWIALIVTGLAGLYFNLLGGLPALGESNAQEVVVSMIISTGWQVTTGGVLAAVALALYRYKSKRYSILAILTIIYFILIFFLYTQISALSGKMNKSNGAQKQQQQQKQ